MSRISACIRTHLGLEWTRKQQLASFSTGWAVIGIKLVPRCEHLMACRMLDEDGERHATEQFA